MTVSVTNIAVHLNLIRNHKVMLDRDLATLYGIPTKALKQAVRRNPDRRQGDRLAGETRSCGYTAWGSMIEHHRWPR
jgi:hypothetical protein